MPVAAVADDLRIELRAGTKLAFLSTGIELNQPKAQMPAFVPFEIIGEAPMKVAAKVHAFTQQGAHLADRGLDEPGTNAISAVRNAILENIDRFTERQEAFYRQPQTFR